MEEIQLHFTANAGVLLRLPGFYTAIDAFHYKRTPPFSPVPGSLSKQLQETHQLDELQAIIVSHCHPDHFSQWMTREALDRRAGLPYSYRSDFHEFLPVAP